MQNKLTAISENGGGTVPAHWSLEPNYPNPFNANTVLPFQAANASANAALQIYNLQGQKIRTLLDGPLGPGFREAIWNGRDASGQIVASGVYLYRLQAGSIALTRKLLFLR